MKESKTSQSKSRLSAIIGIIAGIIAILVGIRNLLTGWPFECLWIFNNHKIVDISSSKPEFEIKTIISNSSKALSIGNKFNYSSDIPLLIEGSTEYDENINIWVVCQDIYAGLYLQQPKVKIENNSWIASNIRPLKDMLRIMFVLVDDEGNQLFVGKTERKDWSKFFELPANSRTIAFIKLK